MRIAPWGLIILLVLSLETGFGAATAANFVVAGPATK